MKIKEILHETIGPHEGKELELMLAGKKPAALIGSQSELKKFKPYVKNGQFKLAAKDSKGFANSPIYLVTLPSEEWRGTQFLRIVQKQRELGLSPESKIWHARMGLLLGYSKEDIQHFLQTRFR